jgi:hypothetical protein
LPGVKIGQGKFGPIDLVIYKGELAALKRIPKAAIDKAKRIEHLKNEKKVNTIIKQMGYQVISQTGGTPGESLFDPRGKVKQEFFCRMEETFADSESINFIFEYCPG